MARRIAVIEDDDIIATAVAERLRSEGFEVDVAGDGPTGVALVTATAPDLVVLDVMLPGFDGFEVCRRIHRDRAVPVIMLTARDDEADQLVGLATGADDYLTKPFSPRLLVARVRALLRRVDLERDDAAAATGSLSTVGLPTGGLSIDADRRRVEVDGDEVHLTATEFDLLACLAARPGVVKTRAQLLTEVWGYHDGGMRTIDSHVRALRRKLGDGRIRTVHGVGYALTEGAS